MEIDLDPLIRKLKHDEKAHFATRRLVWLLAGKFGVDAKLAGCEIGVEEGLTSRLLLKYFPKLHLTMIDPWSEEHSNTVRRNRTPATQEDHDRYRETAMSAITPYRPRCSVHWMSSADAAGQFQPACFDFVFVDGDHSYEGVRSDLELYWSLLKRGGLLCGDDYGGRLDAVGRWGVKQAVDEFAKGLGLEIKTAPLHFFWMEKP